ncbi:MAG: hypothetical protein IPI18_05830 [Saprospiraceae bacterium]|nr:hypothetical protein [Saprospiraceae bacterium]MBP9744863.1 hypothetical protein [Saprospiraceae bacterium]
MNAEMDIIEELKIELQYITQALEAFQYSFEHCSRIGIKENYTFDELDKWEAFTARYGRISDILTQKILGSLMILTDGYNGSLIDKANFAVQQGLVTSNEEFIKLRLLRNFITHEYNKQNTNEVFEKVLEKYSILYDLVIKINKHATSKIFDRLKE